MSYSLLPLTLFVITEHGIVEVLSDPAPNFPADTNICGSGGEGGGMYQNAFRASLPQPHSNLLVQVIQVPQSVRHGQAPRFLLAFHTHL
ncbi:hypothetical protein E2C01_014082 [Portunus trituberculatus]|uniref:Uncharacterized protein n=1 Tax=Portunus trituberculatus TaxID=210409 RepID=A0A5B7DIU4_PORTR|nr:hypothetical protein [Portunus trituberculatus]